MISKEKAIEIIDELDFIALVKQVTEENPCSNFHTMNAYIDLSDGEIFTCAMGNTESFNGGYYICIYSQSGDFKSDISDDDICGDDPMPESGDVEDFDDYEERVIECMVWYATEGVDEKSEAYAQIEEFYNQYEYSIDPIN